MEALTAPVSTALLGVDPLLPIRILAGIAFIYVLRHLRNIERKLIAENLLPTELGPRDNLVLIVCLVPLIVTTLLLFLIIKA